MIRILIAMLLLATGASWPSIATAAKPLEVEVLQTSAGSLYSNVALIKGEKKAVLVDPPFTRADAHRVVAMVLESGKSLETIFVTHDHPDHFFAMEVLSEAFPDAKIVAHPVVVADIWRSLPFKVKRWSPVLGANGPRTPTAPLPIEGDTITLEGHEMKVIGPMWGDHVHATALWVPSIKALVAGDLLFNQMFLWMGEHDLADIAAWGQSVDRLAALKPELVVPGHSKPGMPNDSSALEFSRAYIAYWHEATAAAKDSADLTARVRNRFPQAIDVLDNFILGNSAKVAKGEEPKWQE
jgi:glyoxylase-like metal-dependent hydrolase (beta-lactamase superfamily II)